MKRILTPAAGLLSAVALSVVLLSPVAPSAAQTTAAPLSTYILTDDSRLVMTTDAQPFAPGAPQAITGLTSGDILVAIDVRPQTGSLYGLAVNAAADTVTVYTIEPRNGRASLVGAPAGFVDAAGTTVGMPDPATVGYGFDFNPTVDRIRVVTGSGLNFRLNPNNGAAVDGNLNQTPAPGGTNPDGPVSGAPGVEATAYTNSAPNVTVTTQYTLDATGNRLLIQNPPNAGNQTMALPITLNGAPLDFSAAAGFDIPAGINATAANAPVTSGSALAVLTVDGVSSLYRIDLTSGAATLVGPLTGLNARGLAVIPPTGQATALSADGTQLLRLTLDAPGTPTAVTITGVVAGEALVGIDGRPAGGQLFGLGVNDAANTATLYIIDPQTGVASIVNTVSPGVAGAIAFVDGAGAAVDLPPASAGYGFDFNPTVDRIRVVTGSGLNVRLNPTNGLAVDGDANTGGINPDGVISGAAAGVVATAYTGSVAGATITTQYTLDATGNQLLIQNPPNAGSQSMALPITLNGALLDFTAVGGFDIPSGVTAGAANAAVTNGSAYAALTVGGSTQLYRIDLATGAAAALGAISQGSTGIGGLAVWTAPNATFRVSLPFVAR
jgi:Domain of unknown function (DUF4394)